MYRLRSLGLLAGTILLSGVCSAAEPAIDPLDWPHWRGPEMNGISREKNLPESWSPDGENLVWKSEKLATRSTPIILRGKLYTITRSKPETTEEGEKVVCADANTGKIIWESIHNVFLTDAPAERVGWSAVVGDPTTGNVFAHGICGVLKCLDGETGKVLWQHSLSEEYGILSTYGGRTNFPTIFEDLVIVSGVMTGWGEYSVPAHRMVAFDKRTGQAIWIHSTRLRPPDTTYSTPILATFNGQKAIVFGASDGAVHALQPRTGKEIWKYDASIRGMNQTPVISGNKVWSGHSEEDADDPKITGSFFCIDGSGKGDLSNKKPIWSVKEVASGRSAPLLFDNRLYVTTDAATMFILDATNGTEVGKQKMGTIMMSSVVFGDGKIYAGEATGRPYIMKPTKNGVKVIHKLRLNEEEMLGSPVISHGKVYFPTNANMYCIGLPNQKPSADPIPTAAAEISTDADLKPAQIQIVPVEVLLKPGQKQQFLVRTFNAAGRYLKSVPVTYEVQDAAFVEAKKAAAMQAKAGDAKKSTPKKDGPSNDKPLAAADVGKIDSNGVFTPPSGSAHTAALVIAKYQGLTSTARVRTIPALPWNFDFSNKQVPITWIGVRYRHVPRVVDKNPLIAKITTIPLGTRSQGWFGAPDVHDATIQAEAQALPKEEALPDIGLINQRYTLDLMGNEQQLQLRSWTSRRELRFAKNEPFRWKAKTWYVLKLRAENKDGQAILKGKVWPRGEKEPEKWTIEASDATPNTLGSPGLFGNSLNSEILIDNVKVYANE